MRTGRYLLALVPVAAIWLYAMAQSGGQLFALMEGISGSTNDAPERPSELEVEASIDRGSRISAPDAAPSASAVHGPSIPNAPAAAPERPLPPPRDDGMARIDEVQLHLDENEDPFAGRHPDITDPKIRKLLQAAWAD
jgi:hypothetical protein